MTKSSHSLLLHFSMDTTRTVVEEVDSSRCGACSKKKKMETNTMSSSLSTGNIMSSSAKSDDMMIPLLQNGELIWITFVTLIVLDISTSSTLRLTFFVSLTLLTAYMSTGVRFTKQFGGKTAPKVCNKVTNFGGRFHPKTFCETHPSCLQFLFL